MNHKQTKIIINKKDLPKIRKYFLLFYVSGNGYYLGREKRKSLFERLFNL